MRGADESRNVQVLVIVYDLLHCRAPRVAVLISPILVRLHDSRDVGLGKLVLPLAFREMLRGIDEEHVVRLLALLKHEDADRDARRVEEIGGQTDDGVDV